MEHLIQIEQVLQIGAKLLQIRAALVATNWGNIYYNTGQNYHKARHIIQIRGNYYKSVRNILY